MSYCLNSYCSRPENSQDNQFCNSCGAKLLLKGRYRAIKTIGQGGFGKTFLSIDEDIPSKPYCVIKQFFPSIQGSNALTKAKELFNQEAIRLDDLGKHKQIPQLLAYFEENSQLYLVQQFINGENLLDELKNQGRFNEFKLKELLESLLPVLQFVHEKKVIHRDIKPENIIRDQDGKLVLIDFGVSKQLSGTVLSNQGTIVGTNSYAAPEQMRGIVSYSSDLYSLAVTAIRLFTGCFPKEKNGMLVDEIFDVYSMSWCWEKWLTQNNIKIDTKLIKIINKMLAEKLSDRFQSCEEVLKELNINTSINTPPIQPTQVINKPVNIPQKSTSPQPKQRLSQIEIELQQVKTEITNTPKTSKPKTIKSILQTSTSAPKNVDPIKKELEELKEEFSNFSQE